MNKQEIEKAIETLKKYHDLLLEVYADYSVYSKAENYSDKSLELASRANTVKNAVGTAITHMSQQLTNGWISVSERLPEEYKRVDGNDCYSISNEVICGAYNEVEQIYETWIDYTIDGEWQTHEYYEDEILAWQPLPEPYKEVSQ